MYRSYLLVHEDVHGGVQVLVAAGAALQELESRKHPGVVGRARRRQRRNPHRGRSQDCGQLLPRRRLDDEPEPDEQLAAGGRHCCWRRGRGTHSLLEVEEAWRSWDHSV